MDNDFKAEGEWTVTVNLHPGYAIPDKGHKVVCFDSLTGKMIPQYQIRFKEVEDLGNRTIRLTFEEYFSHQYRPEFERANAIGNFICMEVKHRSHEIMNLVGGGLLSSGPPETLYASEEDDSTALLFSHPICVEL